MNPSKDPQPEHCECDRWAHGTQICRLGIETSDAAPLGKRQGPLHPQARKENYLVEEKYSGQLDTYLLLDGQELNEEIRIVDIVFEVAAPSKWCWGMCAHRVN